MTEKEDHPLKYYDKEGHPITGEILQLRKD